MKTDAFEDLKIVLKDGKTNIYNPNEVFLFSLSDLYSEEQLRAIYDVYLCGFRNGHCAGQVRAKQRIQDAIDKVIC